MRKKNLRLICCCSVPQYLSESTQVHVHRFSDAVQPFHPLTPSSPSALNLSQHQGFFQWISCSRQMTKILDLQLQHQSFQQVFRVDFPWAWPVWSPCWPRDSQESSPAPQFEGINSLVFCLLFPFLQPCMTTGKTIALTIRTFVGRVMSLLFNKLSRFVLVFLPRSSCLLISWLHSPSAMILEPKKRKSVTTTTFPPSICHAVMGLGAMILDFYI